ncbi:MAG: putative lipid II flippase FtsW [Candidatus Dadabacteria bacterium]|nr:MAG: putative lipid II flippase FtsW [Candidatus Dadabacteria bacterium]
MNSRVLIPAVGLMMVGLVAVYTASMPLALTRYDSEYYFVFRQLLWMAVGLVAFFAASRFSLKFWKMIAPVAFLTLLVVLGVMDLAGIASVHKGAGRWIRLGPLNIQPSEFARPVFVLLLAKLLSSQMFREDRPPADRYVTLMGVSGLLIILVGAQPDFGGAVLLGLVLLVFLWLSGAPWQLLTGVCGAGAIVAWQVIISSPYKRGRVLAFLDPWADAQAYGFQLVQSYLALGSGGLTGRGLGLGVQKLFYLPEAHTDFILAVIGEEVGLVGTLLVLALTGWLLFEIWRLATRCTTDAFARYVVTGALLLFGFAALINLAVVTGLAPTKGIALPFVSYGGSTLVASLGLLGILHRIERDLGGVA